MKREIFILLLWVSFCGYSQDEEFGLMVGTMHYMGDLTETPIKFKEIKFGGGFIYRYYFSKYFDIKANFIYGEIGGADSLKKGTLDRYTGSCSTKWAKFRNLSFKSPILDASLEIEFNILPFMCSRPKLNWTPYLVGGISMFYFNPQAKYNGKWYDLQPLCTEGEGLNMPNSQEKYSLTQIAIPYGLGIKYSFKMPKYKSKIDLYKWVIGFEISNRKTFTDHLDDVGGYYPDYKILLQSRGPVAVALSDRESEILQRIEGPGIYSRDPGSPRGNPRKMDQYMFCGFTITKTLSIYNSQTF